MLARESAWRRKLDVGTRAAHERAGDRAGGAAARFKTEKEQALAALAKARARKAHIKKELATVESMEMLNRFEHRVVPRSPPVGTRRQGKGGGGGGTKRFLRGGSQSSLPKV